MQYLGHTVVHEHRSMVHTDGQDSNCSCLSSSRFWTIKTCIRLLGMSLRKPRTFSVMHQVAWDFDQRLMILILPCPLVMSWNRWMFGLVVGLIMDFDASSKSLQPRADLFRLSNLEQLWLFQLVWPCSYELKVVLQTQVNFWPSATCRTNFPSQHSNHTEFVARVGSASIGINILTNRIVDEAYSADKFIHVVLVLEYEAEAEPARACCAIPVAELEG